MYRVDLFPDSTEEKGGNILKCEKNTRKITITITELMRIFNLSILSFKE
jgi:hypothetical protein